MAEQENPQVSEDVSERVILGIEEPTRWGQSFYVQMDPASSQWTFLNQIADLSIPEQPKPLWQVAARIAMPTETAHNLVKAVVGQFVWMVQQGHTWPEEVMGWLHDHRFLPETEED